MHAPSTPGQVLLLTVLVALTFLLLRRPAGMSFAAFVAAGSVAGFLVVGHEGFPIALAVFALAVSLTIRSRRRTPESHPWHALPLQLLLIFGTLLLYIGARILIEGEFPDAHANALRILDAESLLGLHFEPDLQRLTLKSLRLTRFLDTIYSYYFLPFVACSLLWLFLFHRREYAIMRNALGASVLLAVIAIAAFPVAPPRLVAESGMIDTIIFSGREHSFSNEYAAVPSLHVGWMALSGYALALAVRSRWRYALMFGPGAAMLFVVMATGNHYWLDGAVGVVFAVGPAVLLHRSALPSLSFARIEQAGTRFGIGAHRLLVGTFDVTTESPRALFAALSLGALLLFLVVGQIVAPGFTDFWGYLVVQMAVTLVLLVVGEWVFRAQGGLSWQTHLIVVACGYADTLGTAGNLYANLGEYDKFTHFAGVAAVTAGSYDCLRALARRGSVSPWVVYRFRTAIAIGVAAGIGWEVYEAVADDIFETKRVQGRMDTAWDLVFDTLGAIVAAVVVRWAERREGAEEPAWGPGRIS